MIGSLLTRGLVMVFGYAYPAYECFKSVEKNKPDIEQLRFWCQYWILVAVMTVCERIGDTFVSWVPMYSEAKLAFYIYLWYPKTRGTSYVYDSFFRPYIAKHETDIDRNLLELRTRAGDIAVLYWQKAASYSQTRVYDILQYIASQSTPRPPAQATRARQPAAAPTRKPPAATTEQPEPEEPAISASGSSSGAHPEPDAGEVASSGPSQVPAAPPSPAVGLKAQKVTATKTLAAVVTKTPTKPDQAEMMQVEAVSSSSTENVNPPPPPPPPQDTIMEEQVRVTRGRLRRTGASLNR